MVLKTITSQDQSAVSIPELETSVFWIDMLSSIATESLYVLDVVESKIFFVQPDNLFLCGHSVDDALKQGYDFYKKIVHPDDLPLWITQNAV